MKKIISLIALLILGALVLTGCAGLEVNEISANDIRENDEVIVITDKWIKQTDDRDLYMIGTENEVFKIEDNIFVGKLNSSDIYNNIKIGHTYRITTTGFRSTFLSSYRNINTIEEITSQD